MGAAGADAAAESQGIAMSSDATAEYEKARAWLGENGYHYSNFDARTGPDLDSNYEYVFEVWCRPGRGAAIQFERAVNSGRIMSVSLMTEEDVTATEAKRKPKRRKKPDRGPVG